jgi:hypothetical protein
LDQARRAGQKLGQVRPRWKYWTGAFKFVDFFQHKVHVGGLVRNRKLLAFNSIKEGR